eukprot:1875634-Pyramimonas_sp.AAC.1
MVDLPAEPATGAFGGAPYGATKRCVRNIPKWVKLLIWQRNMSRGSGEAEMWGRRGRDASADNRAGNGDDADHDT